MRRTLLMSAALLALSGAASAQTYGGIQAFGDSLTDNGNLFALTRTVFPIPASPPYYAGRFSNGPVWVEQLMPRLGLPAGALDDRAYGGAETGLGPGPGPGVLAQVGQAVTFGPRPGPNTLVVLWGGANDYRNRGRSTPDPAGLVDGAINNLRQSLQLLIDAGARAILVPNVPNLGDTPEGREQDAATPGTAARLNGIIAGHNAALAQTVERLRQGAPGVRITVLDVNALFRQVVAAPATYGFSNTTVPCLLGVAPDIGPASGACATPEAAAGTAFFDKLHPSTAAHALIAQFAAATLGGPAAAGNAAPARAQMAMLSAGEQARAIAERLAALRGGVGGVAVLGSGLPTLTGATAGGVSEGGRLSLAESGDRPFGMFLYGTHDWGDREARDGRAAFRYRGSLVALGADYRVAPGLTLGAAFGYGVGESRLGDGHAEARSWKLSAYAGYHADGFYADADLGYSIDRYPEIRRDTGFAFTPQARGDTRGSTWSAGATVGYDAPIGGLTLGPFAGARTARVRTDAFTERGAGALNLGIDGTRATSLTGSLGVRLGGVFTADTGADTVTVAPHVRLAWEHEFSRDARRVTARLGGGSLTAEPGVGARDALVAGVGVRVQVSDRLSLVADYAGTLARADGRDHSLLGKVEVKF